MASEPTTQRMSARETVMDDIAIKRLQEFCDGTRGPYTNLAADLEFALVTLKDRDVAYRSLSADLQAARATALDDARAAVLALGVNLMQHEAVVGASYLVLNRAADAIRALKEG